MGINTQALSRIFNNTTNSYKYLFFISLLELLRLKEFKSKKLTYRELSSMMLAVAWYPKTYFRLSFGKLDQVGKYLEKIDLPRKLIPIGSLYEKILSTDDLSQNELLRYVPQRLIREFFKNDTAGLKDSLVDSRIVYLSDQSASNLSPPLYVINEKNQTIEFANVWLNFLKDNFNPIFGWSQWHWATYLQRRNPNTPAIISKLSAKKRESLIKQKFMWNSLIQSSEIRCIYTNEKITKIYHLDHFLPWSFVAHNQPWNLVPTSPEVNLSKSDSIPNEIYIPALAGIQHKMLLNARKLLTDENWFSEVITYLDALHVDQYESLLNLEHLENHYIKTYNPLIEIAKNNGFPGDWVLGI